MVLYLISLFYTLTLIQTFKSGNTQLLVTLETCIGKRKISKIANFTTQNEVKRSFSQS
jgi:hypothetical protein